MAAWKVGNKFKNFLKKYALENGQQTFEIQIICSERAKTLNTSVMIH